MEAIASVMGSSAMGQIGSAFGLSGEMIKALGSAGDGADAARKAAQSGIAGSEIPRAMPRQVSLEQILAVLKDRNQLGT